MPKPRPRWKTGEKKEKKNSNQTFMLASDRGLVQFVAEDNRDVAAARHTSPLPTRWGQYLLMDYMSRKTKTVH